MTSIEQAVFTSAQTDRSDGYQVVAASPGVSEADVRELAAWGPSHDAMLRSTPGATSINFHPLPSGAYCVGRTTPAGSEYSGRRGARVYTQSLVVSAEVLGRFANNPFALLKAVSASGALRAYETVPKRLNPLRLVGRAAAVDESLLGQLRQEPGPEWMATLVQAALDSPAVAVAGGIPAEKIIAGLINCLPPECRTEFSFSTGLKLSSRRPFRVVALPGDPDEQRRANRLYDLSVLDLAAKRPSEFTPTESWARLVERVLRSSQVSFLGRHLSDDHIECSLENLSAFGLQLLEELDTFLLARNPSRAECGRDGRAACGSGEPGCADAADDSTSSRPGPVSRGYALEEPETPGKGNRYRRGHKPHRQFQEDLPLSAAKLDLEAPSETLSADSPETLEKLERLDDLVYEAMSGCSDTVDELKEFWTRMHAELGDELVAESREQYLRYALTIWEKSGNLADPASVRRPDRAIQALDVLCVIFDEV